MRINTLISGVYILASILLTLYSYGFTDSNLVLSDLSLYKAIQKQLAFIVYRQRDLSLLIFIFIIFLFFSGYISILRSKSKREIKDIIDFRFLGVVLFILFLAFPAFSYDIFNYILTAKLTFFYHENPYLTMPIEIPNEPMLAYTRAANKLTLYGPVWILLTGIPYLLGRGNIWLTLFAFKLLNLIFYLLLLKLIFRLTRNVWNVYFFALNPLVLIEVLISSHNDIVMMVLSLYGLYTVRNSQYLLKVIGIISLGLSILIKGATLVLFPLLFFPKINQEKMFKAAFFFMFGVFLLTPIREEMYPWYAIWFITFAAVVPQERYIHSFTIVISFSLLLRYLPYIYTREYGGSGPMWRLVLTTVPVGIYLFWVFLSKILKIVKFGYRVS